MTRHPQLQPLAVPGCSKHGVRLGQTGPRADHLKAHVLQVSPDVTLGSANIGSLQDSENNDQNSGSGKRRLQQVDVDPEVRLSTGVL